MKAGQGDTYSERKERSAEARKAVLAKFQPKPAVVDPTIVDRTAERAAARAEELSRVRLDRADAKAARKQAAEDAVRAAEEAVAASEAETLALKRGDRKERKALTKAEAKTKRDERYAARKARR